MLVHTGVRLTLVAAGATGLHTRLEHGSGDVGVIARVAREHALGRRAHVGAVQAGPDALDELGDHALAEACIRARGAGLSTVGAGYAALFLTEGTGLLFRKRWAEWLTIIATGSFMPLELYELIKEFTPLRLLVLLVNAAVVLFLIYRVREKE